MDDLLDGTLDDLADVPEFKPFNIGAHRVKINWKLTVVSEIPSIELGMTMIEHVELTNPEDKANEPGAKTAILFMLKKKAEGGKLVRNELAEGQWKEILASLREGMKIAPEVSNREVMTQTEGMEVMAVTTVRKVVNKQDKNDVKFYTAIKNIAVI